LFLNNDNEKVAIGCWSLVIGHYFAKYPWGSIKPAYY